MKARGTGRVVASLVLSGMLVLAVVAHGEVVAPPRASIEGVTHHWVVRQMAYAPYTELTTIEQDALSAARTALAAPPTGLLTQAEHGYQDAQALVDLGRTLKDAAPVIVGHELVVWNSDNAARLYVSADGPVKVLEVGSIQRMLVSQLKEASDQGDSDAIEIARGALDVAAGLDPGSPSESGALVAAHAVGFARQDGSHLIVRVDLGGNTSYPDW